MVGDARVIVLVQYSFQCHLVSVYKVSFMSLLHYVKYVSNKYFVYKNHERGNNSTVSNGSYGSFKMNFFIPCICIHLFNNYLLQSWLYVDKVYLRQTCLPLLYFLYLSAVGRNGTDYNLCKLCHKLHAYQLHFWDYPLHRHNAHRMYSVHPRYLRNDSQPRTGHTRGEAPNWVCCQHKMGSNPGPCKITRSKMQEESSKCLPER